MAKPGINLDTPIPAGDLWEGCRRRGLRHPIPGRNANYLPPYRQPFLARELPRLLVEAKVVHMPIRDKDVAHTRELAKSKPAKVEEQGTPLKHEIHIKHGIVEG
jgi:hypothetical protein